jgi:hypothetical protein
MNGIFDNELGGKLPAIVLTGNASYGTLAQDTGFFPWSNANPTYTYRDNITKVQGNHTLIFGAYFVAAQKNEDNAGNVQGILTFSTSSPVSTGNSFADMLMGNVAQYTQTDLVTKYYQRYKILEPYFQDDWRVTKRLTLNLGFRLSMFGTYREKYQKAFGFSPSAFSTSAQPQIDASGNVTGHAGALVPGTGNPFNGQIQCGGPGGNALVPAGILTAFPGATTGSSSNAGCSQGHLWNPAPRMGFAFDPKGDGKTAIRGGYGIFYEHTNGNEANTESLEGSPPYVMTASQFNVLGYGNVGGGAGTLFPLIVTQIPDKVQWPYVQQWNLNVQRELPEHVVLSDAYVGSKGTHLTMVSDANQLEPVAPGSNPYTAGTPIVAADCANIVNPATGLPNPADTLGNGTPVPAAALANLFVACGNSADLVRSAHPGMSDISNMQLAANSIYNALQVAARRTVGDLTVSLAYTYSHSIDDCVSVLVCLVLETGIRAGELAGLRTENIQTDRIQIRQTKWNGRLSTPKSPAAVRDIAISPRLSAALQRHFKDVPSQYVLSLSIDTFRKRAGTKLHVLRHFNASLMDTLNIPLKVRQVRLGHASAGSITLDTYTHSTWADNVKAANAIGDAIEKAAGIVSPGAVKNEGPAVEISKPYLIN